MGSWFLVHEISDDPFLAQLKNAQKKSPIKVNQLTDVVNWSRENGVKFLPGVKNKTTLFSTMLNKQEYKKIIDLRPDIYEIIKTMNDKRNELHFFSSESGSYSPKRISELDSLVDFVNTEIRILQNQIVTDLGLGDEKKLKKINAQ